MTIDQIIHDHRIQVGHRQYKTDRQGRYRGVRGSEFDICGSDNHYFDMGLVPAEECHARTLMAEVERLRSDNDHLRFILSFHNLTPAGNKRACDPACIACEALR